MSSYESLEATIDLIVDAAIESEMYLNGYEGTVGTGFDAPGPLRARHRAQPVGAPRLWRGGDRRVRLPGGVHAAVEHRRRRLRRVGRARSGRPSRAGPSSPTRPRFESLTDRCRDAAATLTDGSLADRGVRHHRRQPGARRHRHHEHRARPVQRRDHQRVHPQLRNRLPIVVRGQSAIAAILWFGVGRRAGALDRGPARYRRRRGQGARGHEGRRGGGGGRLLDRSSRSVGAVASIAGLFVPGAGRHDHLGRRHRGRRV